MAEATWQELEADIRPALRRVPQTGAPWAIIVSAALHAVAFSLLAPGGGDAPTAPPQLTAIDVAFVMPGVEAGAVNVVEARTGGQAETAVRADANSGEALPATDAAAVVDAADAVEGAVTVEAAATNAPESTPSANRNAVAALTTEAPKSTADTAVLAPALPGLVVEAAPLGRAAAESAAESTPEAAARAEAATTQASSVDLARTPGADQVAAAPADSVAVANVTEAARPEAAEAATHAAAETSARAGTNALPEAAETAAVADATDAARPRTSDAATGGPAETVVANAPSAARAAPTDAATAARPVQAATASARPSSVATPTTAPTETTAALAQATETRARAPAAPAVEDEARPTPERLPPRRPEAPLTPSMRAAAANPRIGGGVVRPQNLEDAPGRPSRQLGALPGPDAPSSGRPSAERPRGARGGVNRPADYRSVAAFNPPPRYPYAARRRGLQGQVIVRALVGADGRALDVRVQQTSGHRMLDRAAVAAVRGWRFKPALKNGAPAKGRVDVPITFRLKR